MEKNKNYFNVLSAYLAEDPKARSYFAGLAPEEQKQMASRSAQMTSRDEVRSYVQSCMDNGTH